MTQLPQLLGGIGVSQRRPLLVPQTALSGVAWRRRYQQSLRITDTLLVLTVVLESTSLLNSRRPGPALDPSTMGLAGAILVGWLAMMYMFRTRDSRLIGTGSCEYKRIIHGSAATFSGFAVIVVTLGITDFRFFLVDLMIMWRTFKVMLRPVGAY